MKSSQMLFTPPNLFASNGGGIPLSIKDPFGSRLVILGASVSVSAPRGQPVTSCTVFPDGPGILAVAVKGDPRASVKRIESWHGFFIEVVLTENGLALDLEKLFVPRENRMGQILDSAFQPNCDQGGYISVLIDGQEYSSMVPPWMKRSNLRMIDNPDLLCRYLYGNATADEVKAADLSRQSRIFEEACHRHAHAEWTTLRGYFGIDGPESVSQHVIAAYEALKGQIEVLQRDLADERILHAEESEIRSRLEREYMESMREIATVHRTLSGAIPTANPCLISDGVDGLSKLVVMAVEEITALRKVLASVAAEADETWFGLKEIRGIVASARKRGLLPSK